MGRRTLEFGMSYQTPKREIDQLFDITFTSASVPQCSIVLEPGTTLLVIDELEVPRELLHIKGSISLKAFVDEWRLEDGRYYIQARSQRTTSDLTNAPFRE
jgi:hypothetical protein